MSKFPWGNVVWVFTYDLDGYILEVVKYYAKICNKQEWETEPSYHIEELHASYASIQEAIIAYFAYKNIGLNVHALVGGVCRALCVGENNA